MKPIRTWVLVADGRRARFLENLGPEKGLQSARDRAMQQALPPDRELTRDQAGFGKGPGGDGHGLTPKVDHHEFAKERFAHEVAEVLIHARKRHEFDRLVLVAPPKEMGHLRNELDDDTRKMVVGEIKKELVNAQTEELHEQLGTVMAV
ncbi:baeRF12 domain-containing protein [Rhodovibrio salinarum]|uniref:Host attachment protein n=1 Tax=Rhodovibrio salinarum TaxID=1087 RepID=A0A934QFU7_9PROT|nr:host attachment family protein [Rhodovibrio salinarum]MBK1696186.1 host attachment protein [Rhodovibrio salinarum]